MEKIKIKDKFGYVHCKYEFSSLEENYIIQRYKNNIFLSDICKEFNISKYPILRVLNKYNIEIRDRGDTNKLKGQIRQKNLNLNEVIKSYKEIGSILGVCQKYKVGYGRIKLIVSSQNLPVQHQLIPIDKIELTKLYEKNYSLKEIANYFNCSEQLICKNLKKYNLKRKRVYRDYERKNVSERIKREYKDGLRTNRHPTRGKCCYYFNKAQGWVYLKSSWELIVAKWLDGNHKYWLYEPLSITYYNKVGHQKTYHPDFFVEPDEIWEVKGVITDKSREDFEAMHKCKKFRVLTKPDIEKYGKELEELDAKNSRLQMACSL